VTGDTRNLMGTGATEAVRPAVAKPGGANVEAHLHAPVWLGIYSRRTRRCERHGTSIRVSLSRPLLSCMNNIRSAKCGNILTMRARTLVKRGHPGGVCRVAISAARVNSLTIVRALS
jgi:hypothetical protein